MMGDAQLAALGAGDEMWQTDTVVSPAFALP